MAAGPWDTLPGLADGRSATLQAQDGPSGSLSLGKASGHFGQHHPNVDENVLTGVGRVLINIAVVGNAFSCSEKNPPCFLKIFEVGIHLSLFMPQLESLSQVCSVLTSPAFS